MKIAILPFLYSLASFYYLQAQGFDELGTWNILNGRYILSENWSVVGEAQLRSLGFYGRYHYYEIKGGAVYRVSPQLTLAGFVGTYQTYADKGGNFDTPKINDEERLWLQATLHNNWKRLQIEHRYRWENRWTLRGYRLRFRYRLQLLLPINSVKLQAQTFYTVTSNELFLTNRATYFERNRFFIGLGYQWNEQINTQVGWLNQFDYFINDEIGKNFFQISLNFTWRSKKMQESKSISEKQP
ncbi:MAG: DUF2490 domain-containing protein [Raineya sp.]